ncbi:sensor histidine kinase [Calothrix sp. NIES-3974]|uniref:sensor histidine kinase n=1 Tax=Calothrix sp. NIES-3974 TaxID=2005462 RepID=UPI000B5E2196|nr:ATP-binding protein [Calothrix sp. NIES-3974]BAZ07368.1 two-component sensor histidine kinase [Calothrix sp. NIES-3974]
MVEKTGTNLINRCFNHLPVRYRGAAIIAIPAICLFASLAAWVISRDGALQVYRQIDKSKTIIIHTNGYLKTLLDAETNSRGYALSRNPIFLDSYNQAINRLPSIRNHLERSLYNQNQKKRYQKLEGISQRLIASLNRRNQLVQNNLNDILNQEQEKIVLTNKANMDKARELINQFQEAEWRRLTENQNRFDDLYRTTNLIIWGSVIMSIFSYLAAIYLYSNLDWRLQGQQLALNQNSVLLQGIFENVVDGIIVVDAENCIENLNSAAEKIFGYTANQVIGRDLGVMIRERTEADHPITWNHEQINKMKVFSALAYIKEQTYLPVEISISTLPTDNRKIVIIRDISEREEAQAKLEANIKELSQLRLMLANANQNLSDRNQELDQFAYVASHDLKAPLRAIANLSTWIEEDLGDNIPLENKKQLQLLRQRVNRMESLLNALLDYSRVGRMQTEPENVDVHQLLAEIIDSLDPPRGFTIEIRTEMPTLMTKRLLLRQVFANLISNAIKHHPRDDGNVYISAIPTDKYYEFQVSDDGLGIAPEYHHQIFTIFQTLQPRDSKESTGVGLAIVKKIIESEGGSIHVISQVGEGATFSFTWPVLENQ